MNSIGKTFFKKQEESEKKNPKRKKTQEKQTEQMAINKDDLSLIGKPVSLHNVDSRIPTALVEVETGEFSTFHVNRVTSNK